MSAVCLLVDEIVKRVMIGEHDCVNFYFNTTTFWRFFNKSLTCEAEVFIGYIIQNVMNYLTC